MKLTSRLTAVKRTVNPLLVAALATALTAVSLGTIAALTDDAEGRSDAYADSIAAALANLTVEPLLKQDRIALGVLINRALEIPGITGVQVFTIDNQILAATGEMRPGSRYTQPVVLDDSIMGYVRVALGPGNARLASSQVAVMVLVLLMVPPLVAFACRWRLVRNEAVPGRSRITVEMPAAEEEFYLVAVNLYDQISFSPERLGTELHRALKIAGNVAALYGAQAGALPGTGLLLSFPKGRTRGRSLQVVCAAFLLAELLAGNDGAYRFGVHIVRLPTGQALPAEAPEITDVALLSALAKGRTLVASNRFPIGDADGLEQRSLPPHPLMEELTTIGGGARLITGLSNGHRGLIAQQARRLGSQWDEATASESTF